MKTICTLLVLAACAFFAGQASATGGWYDERGYHAAVEEDDEPCGGAKGGIVATREGTTGIRTRPDGTSYWFHTMIYTCGDGSEVEVEVELGNVAGFIPDDPAPAAEPGDPEPWRTAGFESECAWLAAGGGPD